MHHACFICDRRRENAVSFKQQAKELVKQMTVDEKISQLQSHAKAIERLGVPEYDWWNECLHGAARCGTATVFPQSIAMAASFNEELVFEVANVISDEVRAKYNEFRKTGKTDIYQGITMCAPNINIFRDPRWGRGHETYGEDPYLTSKIAAAYIKGLQGNGKYRKTDAILKHYAVHSGPEVGRRGFNAEVSEQDLFETYLKAFEYCIEKAKPSGVMGAYNAVNGTPCCINQYLLDEILRKKFGFDGYTVTDAGAIEDINKGHGVTKSLMESAALALKGGIDLNIGTAYEKLGDALECGLITEEDLNPAAERLMEARLRLGMGADDCKYDKIPYEIIDCEKHRQLNLKIARESIVLLKNNGILPIDRKKDIAVIGPAASNVSVLVANYCGTPSHYTTFLDGIQKEAEGVVYYARGCEYFSETCEMWDEKPNYEAIIAAKKSDAVIMFLGLNPLLEGEEGDAYNKDAGGDKSDLELTILQQELYEKIIALGKPVIFVNVSGSCINLLRQDKECDAVIQCFYPGAEGGTALADIIFGNCSPSGRLPVTFYAGDQDLPPFKDYSMENRTYRFFRGKPVYEFGHGLSYADIKEEWLDKNIVRLTNSSKFGTDYSVLKFEAVPHKTLCGFKKVYLKPDEIKTITFE